MLVISPVISDTLLFGAQCHPSLGSKVPRLSHAITPGNTIQSLFHMRSIHGIGSVASKLVPSSLFILRFRVRLNLVSALLLVLGLPPDGDLPQES